MTDIPRGLVLSDESAQADWIAKATDLTDDLAALQDKLSIGRVSDSIGLAENTIMDTLTRSQITSPADPRSALCRPEYRVGRTPFWSHEQVEEYKKIAAARRPHDDSLPRLTAEQVKQCGLVTTQQIRARLGVHDQTLRRYQRSLEDYPPAVARLSREGAPGVSEQLRVWRDVIIWARKRRGLSAKISPRWNKVPDEKMSVHDVIAKAKAT